MSALNCNPRDLLHAQLLEGAIIRAHLKGGLAVLQSLPDSEDRWAVEKLIEMAQGRLTEMIDRIDEAWLDLKD